MFSLLAFAAHIAHGAAPSFNAGDWVRLNRSETLLFKGQNFMPAPKGQEFSVLKNDAAQQQVYVAYFKEDDSMVAVTLPAEALEVAPRDGWGELLRGMEAFRDQRADEARRGLAAAAQDPVFKNLGASLQARINGALAAASQASAGKPQSLVSMVPTLRDTAVQLDKMGYPSLALALEEGVDRLGKQVAGGGAIAPSKLDRGEIVKRVTASTRAVNRCRQAVALHKMVEAKRQLDEGLKAEPARPELKALQARVEKEIADAEDDLKAAERMRKFAGGTVHALTALERGLKRCVDDPRLKALKKEMESAFEERTSPQVTAAMIGGGAGKDVLEEGRKLYTTRCTECHDLELLDSRTMTKWEGVVGGMARRAHLDDVQRGKIIQYISAAQATLK